MTECDDVWTGRLQVEIATEITQVVVILDSSVSKRRGTRSKQTLMWSLKDINVKT